MSAIKLYHLYPSTLSGKKWDIYITNPSSGRRKKVSFGARGYSDYTIHKDLNRRELYRTRHANDHISDPTSSGFWSWHLLWGSSTDINVNLRAIVKEWF